MACGDDYTDLVVTPGGYTLDDPYGIPLVTADYAYSQWRELARELSVQAHNRFVELGTVEEERGGGAYPKWNSLVELNNKMTAGYQNLSEVTTAASLLSPTRRDDVDAAIAVIRDALCLMERSDAGIWAYEHPGEPMPVRGRRPWWHWVLGGALLVGGGAGVVYGVKTIRRARRRAMRSNNPTPVRRRRRRRSRSTSLARRAA